EGASGLDGDGGGVLVGGAAEHGVAAGGGERGRAGRAVEVDAARNGRGDKAFEVRKGRRGRRGRGGRDLRDGREGGDVAHLGDAVLGAGEAVPDRRRGRRGGARRDPVGAGKEG